MVAGMDLAVEFSRRAPWITHFTIDGVEYGGDYKPTDRRIPQFFAHFPDVRTILELGSLEGGQTFLLAQHPGVDRSLVSRAAPPTSRKQPSFGPCLELTTPNFYKPTWNRST